MRTQIIRPDGPKVSVDYLLTNRSGEWKVYDVIIENVSMVVTYRSEYAAIIKRDGMDGLPNGKAWYAYNVKRITTTDYTPEQIHQIGLDEVKRIHGEMEGVMKQVGIKGTRNEFFSHLNTDPQFFFDRREDLIAGYDAIRTRVNPQLPKLFEVLAKADYEVRAVEPFREKSAAGGQYQAANEDGSRPGIFYANAYDLRARPKWAMEALSLREANPGWLHPE